MILLPRVTVLALIVEPSRSRAVLLVPVLASFSVTEPTPIARLLRQVIVPALMVAPPPKVFAPLTTTLTGVVLRKVELVPPRLATRALLPFRQFCTSYDGAVKVPAPGM